MRPDFSIFFLFFLTSLTATAAWPQSDEETGKWPLCRGVFDVPPRPVIEDALEPGDIHIVSDKADLVEDGTSHFEGNAEVTQDRQQTRADSIDFHQPEDSADLKGDVHYWDDDVYLHSETAHVEFDDKTGTFEDAEYRLLENRGRGKADYLHVEVGKKTEGNRIDFTTCDPEDEEWDFTNNVWKLSARELYLDHVEERGVAKHAVLKIKDVPVLYTPYISFPLSDKRKTGFLIPSIGSSRRNGFEYEQPFYWNIAPAMDATFIPRIITDSGVMLNGEYRYLFSKGHGQVNVEYLPGDPRYNDEDRSSLHFEHRQSFFSSGTINLLYNEVSDQQYFEDFGNSIDTTSTRYLPRYAITNNRWMLNDHKLVVRSYVQDYQVVDDSLPVTSRPYTRLPKIWTMFSSPYENKTINYDVQAEMDYFTRSDDQFLYNVNGYRYDVYPSVSFPMRNIWGYMVPKAGFRFTQYYLDNNNVFDDSPDRLLPFASVDSGLYFERETTLFNSNYIHTLEPRLYYLYIPDEDQSDLPVFDTGVYNTTYSSLFYQDRFNGPDRMGDANQVTLAVTSTLYNSDTGNELGYARIGQIFYLEDQDVVRQRLNPINGKLTNSDRPVTDSFSTLVAEMGLNITDSWKVDAEIHWEPNENVTEKLAIDTQFNPGDGRILNMGYRVRRGAGGVIRRSTIDIEQTDLSFRWPLTRQWSVVGRWNYAVPESRSLDIFGGIEYESCCWGLRVVTRRFISTRDGTRDSSFGLQLVLKGFTSVGTAADKLLERGILGYSADLR